MTQKKIAFISTLGLGLALFAGRSAIADTITVHDLSRDAATGIYTYTVEFDSSADVEADDGFVIYDFPGEVSYSFSGDFTTSQWSLESQNTSNDLTANTGVDATSAAAAAAQPHPIPFDNASIPNLSFTYQGPFPGTGVVSGVLTIVSDVLNDDTASVYGSVDHSGPTPKIPLSFSANPVTVPTSAPAPAPLLAAAGLMGLVALGAKKGVKKLA